MATPRKCPKATLEFSLTMFSDFQLSQSAQNISVIRYTNTACSKQQNIDIFIGDWVTVLPNQEQQNVPSILLDRVNVCTLKYKVSFIYFDIFMQFPHFSPFQTCQQFTTRDCVNLDVNNAYTVCLISQSRFPDFGFYIHYLEGEKLTVMKYSGR